MKRKGHFIKQQALGELLEFFNRFKDDSYFEHSIICKFASLRLVPNVTRVSGLSVPYFALSDLSNIYLLHIMLNRYF